MNPTFLLTVSSPGKKQLYFILTTLLIIVLLPVMAVFTLGNSVLSFLSLSTVSIEAEGLYQGPLVADDTYAWGNCTYWVFLLRQQSGDPIPTTWGNAATWALNARLGGYLVDHNPSKGAIMQVSDVDNGLGHVAYVENADATTGSWTISEMNVRGLDVVDTQTLPPAAAQNYYFIHDKVSLQ